MTRDILAWRSRDASKPPPLLEYRSSYAFILSTVSVAVFTDIFLYGIVVPVIPFALTTRVGVAEGDVQHWVSVLLAVYGAALVGASPICGYLADHSPSRRLPLLIGLLALLGSTLLLCLGTTLALLIVGRLLQGFSAAVVWTVGLALLADTVGHESIGQSMGYVSMSMSVAVLVAPLLGGVVYARTGYYSVFFMAFGLIVLDIILRVVLVEKKIAKQWMPAVQELPSPSLKMDDEKLAGPSSSPPEAITSPPLPGPEPAQSLSIFPTKRKLPTVLTLLASRRLLAALFCTLIQSALLTAWDAVLPLYVHRLFGWGSTGGGLIFLPLILPSFAAPLIGYWSDKRGPRVPTTLGFLLAMPFLVAMRAVDRAGVGQIVLLCALLACLGVALSMAMTPLLAEITYIVHVKEKSHPGVFGRRGAYATAYGLFNTAFAGGMLVGPIWGGFVTQRSGWATMGWSLAVLSLVGAGVAALLIGGWVGRKGGTVAEAEAEAVEDETDGRKGGEV
ncbi:major facilitator superfamily domain-containing protein [Usnea florida]